MASSVSNTIEEASKGRNESTLPSLQDIEFRMPFAARMLCSTAGGLTLLSQILFGGSLQQSMAALHNELPVVGVLFVVVFFIISNYIFMKTFVALHVLNFNLDEEEKVRCVQHTCKYAHCR